MFKINSLKLIIRKCSQIWKYIGEEMKLEKLI